MITCLLFLAAFVLLFIIIFYSNSLNDFIIGVFANIVLLFLFFGIMRCAAASPTASTMWKKDKRCLVIRNTLTEICNNIDEYEIKEDYSTNNWMRGNITITHKTNNIVHEICIHDDVESSYINWYRNGKLVLRNGYRGKHLISFNEQYYPLVDSWYTTEALNDYIFDLVEKLIEAKKDNIKLSNKYCNTDLLIDGRPSTKTLEVTAPIETTITAEVSQNNNTLYKEQI